MTGQSAAHLTLVRVRDDAPSPLHPALAAELARRGRVWGERNAEILRAIAAGLCAPRIHGGPSLIGLTSFLTVSSSDPRQLTSGFRRIAAPAP